MLATAASSFPVQALIVVVGSGGFVSALVTLYKLRPDVNTSAVTQAQSAADAMAVVQQQLIVDRDGWRSRAIACEAEHAKLRMALDACEKAHGRRRTQS